jgi:hypothetical protein
MNNVTKQVEINKETALNYIHEGIGAQDPSVFSHFHKDARFWQNGKS